MMKLKVVVSLVFVFVMAACTAPTASAPTAAGVKATATSTEAIALTSSPAPSATQPASTEGAATPEAINIATMTDFDRAWFDEVGKTVEVADLYGAGVAKITVAEIKQPAEGQVLEYKEMETWDQSPVTTKWYTRNMVVLGNLTVERMSLLQIDIVDNSRMTDGDWAVIKFGTYINGEKVSFDVFVEGGWKYLAKELFADWEVGDVTNFSDSSSSFILNYFPAGGLTIDDWEYAAGSYDLSVFQFLGNGSIATSRAELLEMIQQGGVLDKRAVYGQVLRP